MINFGEVAPYQQETAFSCGSATLKAVLQHWGERVPERTLMREVGVDPKTGSTAEQVARAARKRGYNATVKQFRSFDELAEYVDRDVPVIVAIRSFKRPDQGHFVVATGIDQRRKLIAIMDPNVAGNRRTLSLAEMARRWRFRDQTGVIVHPKKQHQLGLAEDRQLEPKHYATLAIVGGFTLFVLAEAGMWIYRRRRA